MDLRIVTTDAEFCGLRQSWRGLTTEPLNSFDWCYAWWKNLGKNLSLSILAFESDGELVGVAPFFVDSWIGQKRIRLIGSGKTATDYGRLIVQPEMMDPFAEAVFSFIRDSATIGTLEFEGIRPDDLSLRTLWRKFEHSHWKYDKFLEPTWVLHLPKTWDEFVQASDKSLRRKIRKATKRFDSGQAWVSSTIDGLDFQDAFDVLVDLHQKRFVSKGEPGVFSDPQFERFLKESSQSLCGRKQAEILVGYVEGEPVVAQLYLLGENGPQLYQSGVEPTSMKFEPGHLMFAFAIRKAIENGYPEFDFLRGSESYKPFWGAVSRPLLKTRFVSRSFAPTIVNQTFRALRFVKSTGSSLWSDLKPARELPAQ